MIKRLFSARMTIAIFFGFLTLSAPLCSQNIQVQGEILEMTYPYQEDTVYWPTAKPFHLQKLSWGISAGGWWYASNEYGASEHGGTHADAPVHFAENGRTMDQIPIGEWIGPAVKIDVCAQCEKNRDYLLSVEDIAAWEKKFGRIPERAWVIMYTGIGTKYYPDKKKVLGTDKRGAEAIPELSFPGFSPEATIFVIPMLIKKGTGSPARVFAILPR